MADRLWTSKRIAIAFVIGGLVGLLLDQIHVRYGVLYYPDPWLWNQAWWVLPLFGMTTIVVLSGATLFSARSIDEHELGGSAVWFVAAYWGSGVWQGHPIGLAIAYVLLFALRTTHAPTWLFALGVAGGGVIVELVLTSLGAFTYRFPDVLGLPWWLPGLYAHGTPLALALAQRMQRA